MEHSPSQSNAIRQIAEFFTIGIVYLLGPAGYGKTTSVREAIRRIKETEPTAKICISAMTTVAAEVLGTIEDIQATTFHKWWEIGKDSLRLHDESYIRSILAERRPQNPLDTDILFLDEASMLPIQVLSVMDRVLRFYRGNRNIPFGGLRIVLIGDPLQLQPTPIEEGPGTLRERTVQADSCLAVFDTNRHSTYCILKDPQRCKDPEYQKMLRGFVDNNIETRRNVVNIINKHHRSDLDTIPRIVRFALEQDAIVLAHSNTVVTALNEEVRRILEEKGNRKHDIPGPSRMFEEEDIISIPRDDENIDYQAEINKEEEAITQKRKRFFTDGSLYEGQIVQTRANFDSRNGISVRIGELHIFHGKDEATNTYILKRKTDGETILVGKEEASSEYWPEFKWSGYPFIPANASTIHLVQGCTIPGKVVLYSKYKGDIYGQLPFYLNVAASRVRDPGNFIITHKISRYALDGRELEENLKTIWSLEYMREYPRM